MGEKPLLCLDVDGVINLFDITPGELPPGVRFELIDGVPCALAAGVRGHIDRLKELGELVWATGWAGRANDLLAPALGLPPLPEVAFKRLGSRNNAFWKAEAIGDHAAKRPLAWLDDRHDDRCQTWARDRNRAGFPTLLVPVNPATGLTEAEVTSVFRWAGSL